MDEVTLVAGEGDRDLRERLDQEIIAFNVAATGYRDARLLSIAARGNNGDLCAGLSGWTWGGCGHIELLWVHDDRRGNGLGSRLLAAAETEIRRRGCDRSPWTPPPLRRPISTPDSVTPSAAARRVSGRLRPHPPGQAAPLTKATDDPLSMGLHADDQLVGPGQALVQNLRHGYYDIATKSQAATVSAPSSMGLPRHLSRRGVAAPLRRTKGRP